MGCHGAGTPGAGGPGAETGQELPVGLFSGLSGLAFAAWQLSRHGTRYGRLLARLDEAICARAIVLAEGVGAQHGGVTVGEFDVISGLSGVGIYLLCRRDQPGPAAALAAVIQPLVDLAADENGVPRWNTPARFLWGEGMKETYPDGNLNCGLAHGIPGPLAFLSLAIQAGSAVAGLPEAVAWIADWVCANRCDDPWGINWSTAVPLEPAVGMEAGAIAAGQRPIRAGRAEPECLVLRKPRGCRGALAGGRGTRS